MKTIAIKVPVWEYERGWGSKIDDYMVCLTQEDATLFVKKFNARNNKKEVPHWYMTAGAEQRPITITEAQLEYINTTDKKRAWLSSLEDIK